MRSWFTLPLMLATAPLLLGQSPGTVVPEAPGHPAQPFVKGVPGAPAPGTGFMASGSNTPFAPNGPTVGWAGPGGAVGGAAVTSVQGSDATSPKIELMSFDPEHTQLHWNSGRWEIQSDKLSLRDFGAREHEAQEALNVIRRLHLTQRGVIGHPVPIMEYWLSDGQAPHSLGGGLRLYPIDRASLRVEAIQGQWCVLDDRRLLFNFGPLEQDARQALAVIRTHGFDQIGYVGATQPSMIYFVGGKQGLSASSLHPGTTPSTIPNPPSPTSAAKKDGATGQAGGDPNKDATPGLSPLLLQQAQLYAKGMFQLAPPPTGGVTRLRFDPHGANVQQENGTWRLRAGPYVLGEFGTDERLARTVQQLVQHYGCNEQCLLGLPMPTFSYFLANGHAPLGMHHNLKGELFQPDKVNVREHQNAWYVSEGNKPLLFFGEHQTEAKALADAIKRYRFDCIAQFGQPGQPPVSMLVRTR